MLKEEELSDAEGDIDHEQEPMAPIVPKDSENGGSAPQPDDNEPSHDSEPDTTLKTSTEDNTEDRPTGFMTRAEVKNKKKRRKKQPSRELSEKEIRARLKKKTRTIER